MSECSCSSYDILFGLSHWFFSHEFNMKLHCREYVPVNLPVLRFGPVEPGHAVLLKDWELQKRSQRFFKSLIIVLPLWCSRLIPLKMGLKVHFVSYVTSVGFV